MKNLSEDIVAAIAKHAASIRFGEVVVVIHDGNVVQVEVKEKIRLSK